MKRWFQPIRFIIQACFIAGLITPYFPHSEPFADRLFWTVIVVGVFFCGWVCPFGAIQDWLRWVAHKINLPRFQICRKYQRYLQLSRYILAGLVIFSGVNYAFLNARFYFNDNLFSGMLTWASGITLAVFLIMSLFIDRPFCNYFCVKGALDGIISVLRLIGIRRDKKQCVHCHLCNEICPMNVPVEQANFLRHPNCINCMKCVSVCPKDCIKYGFMNIKKR